MSEPLYILAVDDDPGFCEFLKVIFGRLESCRLTVVQDGDAAETQLQSGDFDLVLLDLKMPKKDGLAVLKYIRATQPDLPVLVLSGIENASSMVQGDAATAFAQKPASLQELDQLLADYVKRYRK